MPLCDLTFVALRCGLALLLPVKRRYSAEDSLPVAEQLRAAGVRDVVTSWRQVEELLPAARL